LERNDYPNDVKIYNLEKQGERAASEGSEEGEGGEGYESKKSAGIKHQQTVGKMLGNDDDLDESKISDANAGPGNPTGGLGALFGAAKKQPEGTATPVEGQGLGGLGKLGDTLLK
jgi:hypothetical protein